MTTAEKPKTVLIDCDGVLTDGTLTIDHNGEKMFKKFHTRDVRAIRELVANGYEVVIVTADDWPGVFHYAEKVGAVVNVTKDKSNLKYENYIAIGDDAWDVKMLQGAKMAFCPVDADRSVKNIKGVHVVDCEGGKGIISKILEYLV
jgi:YrbI family 3-deoxy-D-manno-octulosonate 8-phosphate phosphatase